MLFRSSVPALFSKMQLSIYSSSTQTRKEETAKRLNFYHDGAQERLEEQLTSLFSDPDAMIKVTLNIVKKIINNLAQTYRQPPQRTLENATDADQKLYAEILENAAFDVKMKQASKYVKLLKTILLRPVWRNDKLDLDILTGNLIDVVCGDSPEILEKVLITNYGTSEKTENITYSLWTAADWTKLDYNGNVIQQEINPYKALPFLPVFDFSPPSSGFWLPGGADLVSLQEAINIKLTDLIYLIEQQSFGVGYMKGSTEGATLKADPGSLIELPENGEVGFTSQNAEIRAVVFAIDQVIKWAAVTNGLAAGSMSTAPTEQSGISKQWDSKELTEMRQDDAALFRLYERQLFNLMRIVWNTHSNKKLSEAAALHVDFADPAPLLDGKAQAQADDIKINQGAISPVDIALRDNPDFAGDRSKALAYLLEVKEENRELLI